ncbi:F-box protein CPR1-like [Solanum dulcamara]|uniref:F-box protein CPR1-like n=1 Tax=Solanum dulcamara TaxID=45834 RepID=UPI002486A251|nr:F-box protein CPR1-like [Solanum dulcamara]XP_055827635.1 F-box protein CPR1-like [Solanum dulcamara]XP_055827642.1 F-box protein CPR1-like [Solanum dulcamara]XP_055827650.1 F-box protein CPR1-like [Solanum dulcamara]XP_055827657.1 F-box protein CPR1-like [Solanum dulcamara]XP_055827665.1 F-box protein CPR1-like [Solanum dulcamara]
MTQKTKNEGKLADSSFAREIQKQKKKKNKSFAIPKLEVDLFNQILISSGVDATQKFTQISKGKSVVEPSNDNTDQMDVYRAMTIHFPEVILMDILSRLPAQSLLRFKCVSKFWETLISEPYFKMKHLNRAKNDQDSQKFLTSQMCCKNGIVSMYCRPLSPVQLFQNAQKLDCPLSPTPLRCTIHCCYDGLAVIEVLDNLDAEYSTLLLWNPSTRESIVLPSPEFPGERISCFGLGYDSTSGEYKILQIYQGCNLPCEILALKSGSWRRTDKYRRGSLLFAMKYLTFVHAAFHWIGISRNYAVVVSFSISNEVYGEIPLPEEMSGLRDAIGITVLEGMLCAHSISFHRRKHTIKLWVLKEYDIKESWIPLLSIEDPSISLSIPKYRFADGEVLFWCSAGVLFGTRSGPYGAWPRCDIILDAHAFTESLISPRSLTY